MSRSRAGASAHARYRQLWRAGRRQRVALRVGMAALVALGGTLAVDWRVGLVLAVLVAAADMVLQWRAHDAVRTWRRGALGERRTARRLRVLEDLGYLVLHDRALPRPARANVDHLVVGPAGVFVIDSKLWRRERTVQRGGRTVQVGRRWNSKDVAAAVYEAQTVARALTKAVGRPVPVVPVVAVHGLRVPWRGLLVGDAQVVRASMVCSRVLRHGQGHQLDPATVARFKAAAVATFPAYTS
ncbi:nuclease-related domain-containing protein [Nonomuraea sp. WAC 01424]|uniref:nuclease-related domain-containing protein n=1 Tax=Nonomuraea sp. WAC 01424 TaxID=2203200 RepID=UPI00163BC95D|nr:nuclease-related domain-containing protein [Nonomuraea sp. WAC 01424]